MNIILEKKPLLMAIAIGFLMFAYAALVMAMPNQPMMNVADGASFSTPQVASALGVGLTLAAAIVTLLGVLGYGASAAVIAASLGVGAALAAVIALYASYIIWRWKKNGYWNTVYW